MIVRLFLQWRWSLMLSSKKTPYLDKRIMIQRNSGREIYIILDENWRLNTKKTTEDETK